MVVRSSLCIKNLDDTAPVSADAYGLQCGCDLIIWTGSAHCCRPWRIPRFADFSMFLQNVDFLSLQWELGLNNFGILSLHDLLGIQQRWLWENIVPNLFWRFCFRSDSFQLSLRISSFVFAGLFVLLSVLFVLFQRLHLLRRPCIVACFVWFSESVFFWGVGNFPMGFADLGEGEFAIDCEWLWHSM